MPLSSSVVIGSSSGLAAKSKFNASASNDSASIWSGSFWITAILSSASAFVAPQTGVVRLQSRI